MVDVRAYGTIQMKSDNLGAGVILPGAFNVSSILQDPANINAGILRIYFVAPFMFPPAVAIQPVRVGVDWDAPGMNPFMPDGLNVHRNVFPLPPSKVILGVADERLDIPVASDYESGALPAGGRPIALSSRIELENRLLAFRLLAVEIDHISIQFASFLGQVVRVYPHSIDGVTPTTDDFQQGTVNEILFGFFAAGDLTV